MKNYCFERAPFPAHGYIVIEAENRMAAERAATERGIQLQMLVSVFDLNGYTGERNRWGLARPADIVSRNA